MDASQKDQNRLALYCTLVLNGVILYGLITTQRFTPGAWLGALSQMQSALPAALGLALITVLNSQLSAKAKERIVFWTWENPLPGCRAFSWFLPRDQRINASALSEKFGPFPSAPGDQNRVWYGIYRQVRNEPAIDSISRAYLFARDYAALVLLSVPVLGAVALVQLSSPTAITCYFAYLLLQVALAINAARKNGERLVTTVMAIASAV